MFIRHKDRYYEVVSQVDGYYCVKKHNALFAVDKEKDECIWLKESEVELFEQLPKGEKLEC